MKGRSSFLHERISWVGSLRVWWRIMQAPGTFPIVRSFSLRSSHEGILMAPRRMILHLRLNYVLHVDMHHDVRNAINSTPFVPWENPAQFTSRCLKKSVCIRAVEIPRFISGALLIRCSLWLPRNVDISCDINNHPRISSLHSRAVPPRAGWYFHNYQLRTSSISENP